MKNVVHVFTQNKTKQRNVHSTENSTAKNERTKTGEVRVEVNGGGDVLLNWEDVTVEQGRVLECTRTDKTVHYNRECVV